MCRCCSCSNAAVCFYCSVLLFSLQFRRPSHTLPAPVFAGFAATLPLTAAAAAAGGCCCCCCSLAARWLLLFCALQLRFCLLCEVNE